MWLATIDGQRLFDWAGYYASKLLGHNHPRLLEPDYIRRLVTAANNKIANPDFLTLECLEYYELLYSLAPVCMRNEQLEVYALNSGAEAVENMLKYFIVLKNRKLLQAGRQSGTHRLIYFDQAFHGRTVYTLNVTELSHDPIATKDFHGFAPGNVQVAFPGHRHLAARRGKPRPHRAQPGDRRGNARALRRGGRRDRRRADPGRGRAPGGRAGVLPPAQRAGAPVRREPRLRRGADRRRARWARSSPSTSTTCRTRRPPSPRPRSSATASSTCSSRWTTSACWIPPGAARSRTWCGSSRRWRSSATRG